jgi:5-amino-6-(5-phosphoribosylamino)uracil reductase
VAERPYVLLSAAMSADGYIADASRHGLDLSDAADWDRVDELRAASDAIMVGAQTIRADNPRLLVKSAARRERRAAAGLAASPRRVTVTGTGDLDPRSRFFSSESGPPLAYVPAAAADLVSRRLSGAAIVVAAPAGAAEGRVDLHWLLADLAARNIARLMIEGGATVLAQVLAAGLADEFQLAVAPVFIADARAPRLLEGGGADVVSRRMRLESVSQAGDMAVLRYRPDRALGPGAGQVWPAR